MGIFLLLATIVLVVLDYGANVLALSPWIVFLPLILFAFVWLLALVTRTTFIIDSFTEPLRYKQPSREDVLRKRTQMQVYRAEQRRRRGR